MISANKCFRVVGKLNCILLAVLSFYGVFEAAFVCAQPDDQSSDSSLIDLTGLEFRVALQGSRQFLELVNWENGLEFLLIQPGD